MRPEEAYLRDIVDAADSIESFLIGVDFETFALTRVLRSAVLHELMTIGEACARLPPDLRENYPDVPWREIIGFRNVIVHGYFGLKWDLVWQTTTRNVPVLRSQILAILESECS
jgi:uncharacterized protein with HEPN domain